MNNGSTICKDVLLLIVGQKVICFRKGGKYES